MFKSLIEKVLNSDIETQKNIFSKLQEKLSIQDQSSNEKIIVKDYTVDYVDAEIDFNKMDVFSIERAGVNTSNEKTIIGYFFHKEDEKQIREWVLYVSREGHKKLIEKFNIHKSKINLEK
jgi:hypothetical protein